MEIEELIGLGFTKNQAIVYLSLVKYREASAGELIKYTKLHKKIVYENLERLIDKGLVTYIIDSGIKVFKMADPNMIVELFEEKLTEVEKKKKKAQNIAREIRKLSKFTNHKQEAVIFRGKKGIRTFYNELISLKKDYVVFGAPEASLKIMGEHYWLNVVQRAKEVNIKAKLLFNQSIRSHGEKNKSKNNKVRYFNKKFEPLTETNIQGDRVAVIVWTEEPILFLITDKVVADTYRQYFEDMWKKSVK